MFSRDSLMQDGFSWQAAQSLAFASKLSYEPRHIVETTAGSMWGFDEVQFIDFGETQAFCARSSDLTLLAFRGTESLGDWLGNIDIGRADSPFGDGDLHQGFLTAYLAARAGVLAALGDDPGAGHRLWITGHSLGGALATIAVADFVQQGRGFAGVHTFGQPRVGNGDFRDHLTPLAGERLFRFVNDDDLVTRVPPGWKHVGQLIHFDENGHPKQAGPGEAAGEEALPAMSEPEFDQLQEEIRAIQRAVAASEAGEADIASEVDASLEGIFPAISDHSLDRYIAAIRNQIPGAVVDEAVMQEGAARTARALSEGTRGADEGPAEIPVIIRTTATDWQAPAGVVVNSRVGTFVSAVVTKDTLASLDADDGVVAVEASRDTWGAELETSVPFVGADSVHRPPIDERGDAALVGVIDGGIDILHDAFTNAARETRILAVWDQRDRSGPTPHELDGDHFQPDYGSVYVHSDIETMRSGLRPTPGALRDPGAHGTHVTSIATGRAVGPCPEGMAPEAGIVVVIPNMNQEAGDPASIGYSASHMDALHFLKAVSHGGNAVLTQARPIAVNVSQGMNAGAHDGSSLLEAVFDSVTNKGRDPGCVIVKSAGNERGKAGHARVRAMAGSIVDVTWESGGFRFQDYLEVWYDAMDDLEFTLADPAGNASGVVSGAHPNETANLGGNVCRLALTVLHKDNGDNRLTITILPQETAIQTGTWMLSITGARVGSREGIVDVWVERDRSRAVRFNSQEENVTLSVPGTADTVITVGACGSQLPVRIAPFSSFGRTRKDGPKPDICAPGIDITAAAAGGSTPDAARPDSGTSMAAPHVTGALALVLSRRHKSNPAEQFNAQQLRQAVIRTAGNRAGFHHEGFGWGLLDVEALFQFLKP
jgi:subtilisin family serine protease